MKKWNKLILILVVFLFGAFWVQAQGTTQFINNGFYALFYHAMQIERDFPRINPLSMAIEEFEKAIKAGDPSGESLLMMGMIYQHLNRPGTALGYYLEFAAKQPEETWVNLLIGELYEEMGRSGEASKYFAKASSSKEEDNFARVHYGLGNIALEQKNYLEAKEAFSEALEISGDFIDARLGLAKSLYYLEEYDEAIETLERAQLQAPRSVAVLYYLGQSYQSVGRLEQAEHSFQRMNEIMNNH